jgi:hypothetical protein
VRHSVGRLHGGYVRRLDVFKPVGLRFLEDFGLFFEASVTGVEVIPIRKKVVDITARERTN